MARRAAVYLRISRDEAGEGLGIDRQRDAVKSLARAKGWVIDPAWVIEENDVSAYAKRPRPGFERLVRGIESGQVKAVVAYALDRLVRRLDDLARLIDVAEQHDVPVATVAGDVDLSTGHGRGLAKLLGVVASIEVDHMSARSTWCSERAMWRCAAQMYDQTPGNRAVSELPSRLMLAASRTSI